jgi:hypothetical protein
MNLTRLLVSLSFAGDALANTVDRRFGPGGEEKGVSTFSKAELSSKFNGKVNICEVCKCLEFESTIVRCPFKRLDRKTLTNLDFPDQMHSLDLRFYGIRKTEPSMFNQLSHKNISEVHLGRNKIGRLQSGTLEGLETVRFLDVTSARVGAIENHVFDGLHEMESLWLDENRIGLLPKSIFCVLEHLKELNLKANRVRHIIHGTFQYLKNLEYLYMDSNRIQRIEPSTFYGLNKLKYLGLSKNYLKTLDKGSFGQLMNIDYLDLSQNSKLEDSLTKRISPTCRTWQIEYLACEEYTQYHDEHPQLFVNESVVAVHDDMLCEPVDEIVNFKSGPCEVSSPDTLCCDGKSHLKQIFGLPEYYWRDSCCGETAYSSSMLICCDGELSLRRPNTQCCGSKTFDSETHQCCRDTIISKAVGCNMQYSKFLFSILSSLNEGDQFIH